MTWMATLYSFTMVADAEKPKNGQSACMALLFQLSKVIIRDG